MKRTLAIILVLAMLVCMLPAFSLGITAEEPEQNISGLNAQLYQLKGLESAFNWDSGLLDNIIPNASSNESCSYDDAQHFDASIDQMLRMSKVVDEFSGSKHTGFDLLNRDGYYLKFTGTITAAETGTYYLVGRVIDNGFVAFVDQNSDGAIDRKTEKFYEYWTNHWFDDAGHRLLTDKGGFYLEKDVPTTVEFWYLEMTGGDALTINVSTNSDGSGDVSFANAGLTLDLTRTCYISNNVVNANRINNVLPAGVSGGEPCDDASHWNSEGTVHESGNCSSAADTNNHKFDATFEAVKAEMMDLGTVRVSSLDRSSFNGLSKYGWRYDCSMLVMDGYMTPYATGTYQFGTSTVDNCFVLDINTNTTGEGDPVWVRAYEFWAGKIWNDRSKTYSTATVDLEKDVSYQIRVVYLEIDGGEGLSTLVKINGDEQELPTAVAFTTEKPTAPVKPSVINLFDASQSWYYKKSGDNNVFQIRDNAWMTDKAVYGTWETTNGSFGVWNGSEDNPRNNQSFWAVTEFEVADVSEFEGYELMAQVTYDDNVRYYVNGKLVQVELGWSNGTPTLSFGEEATELLKTGTNVIAIKLVQGWGGFSASFRSLYLTLDDNTNNPYEFHYIDKNGVNQDGRIDTADEWLAYVADANARGKSSNRNDRISIEADLDFDGKDWTPLNEYVGRIFGNGHTFSNITYTATADATSGTKTVGMMFNALTNSNGNGLLYDLTFDNCTFTVNATNGADRNNYVVAGMVAGLCDRGCIENVVVKNSTLAGNAGAAAGMAGIISYNYNEKGVYAENCGLVNTTINATALAGGIVAYAKEGDRVSFSTAFINNVTLNAPKTAAVYGEKWNNNNIRHYHTVFEGTNLFGQTLEADGEYEFFWQTRDAGNGNVDVRIICVTTEAWLAAANSVEVTLTLTDGTTPKSTVVTPEYFFETIKATANGVTDVYAGTDGTVMFGWVIKGVPAAYATESNAPTAVFN